MRGTVMALVIAALPGWALAQDRAGLEDLTACREAPATVSLGFSFDGGACQRIGEEVVEIDEGGTATVTVPTKSTAEVCTMQVVKVIYSGLISVPDEINQLDVQVLNPAGEVAATGDTEIASKC